MVALVVALDSILCCLRLTGLAELYDQPLDRRRRMSRSKMSVTHGHLNLLVPHQFRNRPEINPRHY